MTLFELNPLITGFEIPGPVEINETPGTSRRELEKLIDLVLFKVLKFNLLTFNTLFFNDSLKGVETTTSSRFTDIIVSFS